MAPTHGGVLAPVLLPCVLSLQYLCCELAELQEAHLLKVLRVYDIAHVAWRMKVGGELELAIDKFNKVR